MTKHDRREEEFRRYYAELLGVEELTSEALATALGFDELTPEKLDQWFREEVLAEIFDAPPRTRQSARVVQVDRDEPARKPEASKRSALPEAPATRLRRGRTRKRRG
jgi:hypothetical protein